MLTTGSLRVQRTPLITVLQQQTPSGWRTLRPVRYRADTYYIVGTETDYQVHDLSTLATHVLKNEFEPELPLPDPIEPPASLANLSPLARRFLLLICLGIPAAEVASTLSLSASSIPSVNADLSEAELVPLGARVVSETLSALERGYRLPLDTTVAITLIPERAVPPAVLNEVMPVTEAEARVLNSRGIMRTGDRTDRKSWPFKTMDPMTKVVIPAALAVRAQRAAHAYASLTRKKFRTTRDTTTGNLIVYRVA